MQVTDETKKQLLTLLFQNNFNFELTKNRKEKLSKYYNVDGIKMLETKLNGYLKVYIDNNKYPVNLQIIGFGNLQIQSNEQLIGMIKELSILLYADKVIINEC